MWISPVFLAAYWAFVAQAVPTQLTHLDVASLFFSHVAKNLSGNAFVQPGRDAPIRWSSFASPDPAVVVNVATESDVTHVVKFCNSHNIPFFAQNGGGGWATFDKNDTAGVLINLAGLNEFSPSFNKSQTTVGGGISVNESIAAAWSHGLQIQSGNCDCTGLLGVYLGGGYGNLIGLYGFGVDNIISMRLVTPSGDTLTVSQQSDPDLFWALRGAGPNFGIVTSAIIKSYPVPREQSFAWIGSLVYNETQLEKVVEAVSTTYLQPQMNIFMYFLSMGGPPVVLVTPFLYQGNETSFKSTFSSLYAIPTISESSTRTDYKDFNAEAKSFCIRGARKPSFAAGLKQMLPSAFRNIWNAYTKFHALPGAQESLVLVEIYSLIKARSIPRSQQGSFPYRDLNFNPGVVTSYNDSSLDAKAEAFGSYVRDQWRLTSGIGHGVNQTYINFAHGDEDNSIIYGDSLSRLQQVKRRIDPDSRMRQWFDIKV